MNRAERRAAERKAEKMARKAGFPIQAAAVRVPAEERNNLETETAKNTGQSLAAGASFGLSESEPQTDSPEPISDARLAANRANAQLSTGPLSPEGKAKSSLNAVKTGLTGRTVLLPADDAAVYRQHLDRHFAKHAPATDEENLSPNPSPILNGVSSASRPSKPESMPSAAANWLTNSPTNQTP